MGFADRGLTADSRAAGGHPPSRRAVVGTSNGEHYFQAAPSRQVGARCPARAAKKISGAPWRCPAGSCYSASTLRRSTLSWAGSVAASASQVRLGEAASHRGEAGV